MHLACSEEQLLMPSVWTSQIWSHFALSIMIYFLLNAAHASTNPRPECARETTILLLAIPCLLFSTNITYCTFPTSFPPFYLFIYYLLAADVSPIYCANALFQFLMCFDGKVHSWIALYWSVRLPFLYFHNCCLILFEVVSMRTNQIHFSRVMLL